MIRELVVSPRAEADIVAAADRFLAYGGPTPHALRRLENLIEALEDLVNAPVTFKVSDRFAGVRERIVSGCTIYFRVVPDTGENATAGDVRILHVKLPGQDDPAWL
ncbi:type II toxin-antitoxin system RelE/ParE family toxin [Caulobacter sp. LjRoot300]|uniref:type II toxin-antitoxin system RelE/ParE family toxin n=1 Tax=Caulobacter sp. LjRoot300 TaxID=3342321 RepID=UPI003ED0F637